MPYIYSRSYSYVCQGILKSLKSDSHLFQNIHHHPHSKSQIFDGDSFIISMNPEHVFLCQSKGTEVVGSNFSRREDGGYRNSITLRGDIQEKKFYQTDISNSILS